MTDEHFYENFGFLGLLWPQRERKRVWPKVMEEAKIMYLERLEKARQYRGGQLPKWWVALANIRFLRQMSSLVIEMSRAVGIATIWGIAFRKRRWSLETANKHRRIVNAGCHMGPTHPEWDAFCAALAGKGYCDFTQDEEGKLSWHCQHDHGYTISLLANKWPQIDVEATLKLFRDHGGYCDCEVLFNVGSDVEDMEIEQAQALS